MEISKLFNLDMVLDSKELKWKHLVACTDCDWKGYLEDCKTTEENDGWEYPLYTVYLCPECEEHIEI